MHVIRNDQRERIAFSGIEHVTLAGSDDGLSRLSIWRQSIAAGEGTPLHKHDCEEVVLVDAGSGELHIDGRVIAFGADSTLVIPPDVSHQIVNTGATEMKLVGVFSSAPVNTFFPNGARIELPWRS
jgi:mannose-6-phosphate isomerase-like protein (cupin superfamily)